MAEPETEEAVEVSVQDRIANMLSPDEPGEPEEPETQESVEESEGEEAPEAGPEFIEVEFDGNKYQVPPELKDRLMAEADYTRKTTELANTRRAIELQQKEIALVGEQRQFEQTIAPDLDTLKMVEAYIKNVETQTKWADLSTDEIVRARLELDQLKGQRDELKSTLRAKWDEFGQKMTQQREKLKGEMGEALKKSIPSWSDDTKGAVEKYAVSMGYPEVATQNMSALDYQVAWKAMKYDELQAQKGQAVKAATLKQGKVIQPSSRKPMPDEVQKKLNYRKAMAKAKSGPEKQRLILDRLADKFG